MKTRSYFFELVVKVIAIMLLVAGSIMFMMPFWTSLMISLKTPG